MMAHTLGVPFDLDAVMDLARRHDLWVVEDNCDALGSRYHGRLTGTFGHLATFSFYPAHHITLGEGGCVATADADLARIVQSLRDWGRDCYCAGGSSNSCGRRFSQQFGALPHGYDHKYVFSHLGYNLKVTDMQAAIGCAQLGKLPGFVERRKANFARLAALLQPYEDRLILPRATPHSDPAWFAFPITVRETAGFSRNDLTRYLEAQRIETRNLFSGNLLRHPAFGGIPHRVVGGLANTDRVTTHTFFVGVYPGLDEARLQHVERAFARFMEGEPRHAPTAGRRSGPRAGEHRRAMGGVAGTAALRYGRDRLLRALAAGKLRASQRAVRLGRCGRGAESRSGRVSVEGSPSCQHGRTSLSQGRRPFLRVPRRSL
jgi:CDP-6-deoxy-D-xylo-4-hexulose-3-dehydrase